MKLRSRASGIFDGRCLCLRRAVSSSIRFSPEQQIQLPAWEEYICTLAKIVLQEQSPAGYVESNERAVEMIVLTVLHLFVLCFQPLEGAMIYELMSNCVPSEVILKHELVQWASYYEHRMQRGSKEFFHFEAFLAKFMMLYKKFLLDLYM
ncbi:hypothetical protein PsorP6_009610 [Peronosclerospora sorghi]|uniref:Uncharacterized protein n=1 Tax=Peronosclerospora sorghi TaxID=230839 RepID=A0ACC0W2I1_9STRA|nr:hypothetical protein PsorP6_009610 [Peronosclerospora sorghi]